MFLTTFTRTVPSDEKVSFRFVSFRKGSLQKSQRGVSSLLANEHFFRLVDFSCYVRRPSCVRVVRGHDPSVRLLDFVRRRGLSHGEYLARFSSRHVRLEPALVESLPEGLHESSAEHVLETQRRLPRRERPRRDGQPHHDRRRHRQTTDDASQD